MQYKLDWTMEKVEDEFRFRIGLEDGGNLPESTWLTAHIMDPATIFIASPYFLMFLLERRKAGANEEAR